MRESERECARSAYFFSMPASVIFVDDAIAPLVVASILTSLPGTSSLSQVLATTSVPCCVLFTSVHLQSYVFPAASTFS